jgi:hypothetical protein
MLPERARQVTAELAQSRTHANSVPVQGATSPAATTQTAPPAKTAAGG